MKNIFTLLLVLLAATIYSQRLGPVIDPDVEISAVGDCSSITADLMGLLPGLFYVDSNSGGPHTSTNRTTCGASITNSGVNKVRTKFQLQRKDSAGVWNNEGPPQNNTDFPNLTKGKYRITSRGPIALVVQSLTCPGGVGGIAKAFATNGQEIGLLGRYANFDSSVPDLIVSNEVIVGVTESSDVSVFIRGANETQARTFYYENDDIVLDLSNSNNYNRYRINIFQDGFNSRTSGWIDSVATQIDLNNIWNNRGTSDWIFWGGYDYRVQVFLDNTDCRNGIWLLEETFFSTCTPTEQDQISIFTRKANELTPRTSFTENDQIVVDLSDSENFNMYRVDITQMGSSNYQTSGWVTGGAVTSVRLDSIWNKGGQNDWTFWSGQEFKVRVFLDNEECRNGVWLKEELVFQTCPRENNCRFYQSLSDAISILPNPTSNRFILKELDVDETGRYHLNILDISGRQVKSLALLNNEVDVESMMPGIYVVQVLDNGEHLFTSELVVK